MRLFSDNLSRYCAGRPLANVVDPVRGSTAARSVGCRRKDAAADAAPRRRDGRRRDPAAALATGEKSVRADGHPRSGADGDAAPDFDADPLRARHPGDERARHGHLSGSGRLVDRDESTIRIDESLVEEALKSAPPRFTLTARNPAKQLGIGGDEMVFGLVAGPPNVHDRIRGRRSGNLPDYEDFIRLAHHFNAIHIIGNQVVAPMELPANSRHLDTYRANLTLSDRCFHVSAIGRGRALDGVE